MKKEFCPRPFEEIEISNTGEVYTCCPNWNNFYSIGNIYENTFEEIWNSDKAKDLRQRILNKDYSLCSEGGCAYLKQNFFDSPFETDCKPEMEEYPKVVKFCYDYECNIACKICREKIKRLPDKDLEILNSKIDSFFMPFLQSAKILIINAYGDPFGSRHSRLVIKKAAEKYPDLKFDFHTNGILCNETNFKALNITPDKISKIRISIHAASAKMYGKIVPTGEKLFPEIIKNLKYLKELRKEHDFPVYVHFVVMSTNYKEIPQFIDLAEKYNASPRFWEYRTENCAYDNPENLFVVRQEHKEHKNLLNVLKNKKVIENKQFFSPVFFDLIH